MLKGRPRLIVLLVCLSGAAMSAQSERTGEQVFKAACIACHGPDGKGQPPAILGFEPPDSFPDFTDCPVASVEDDDLWRAVITRGGRARGLSHIMPAFGDVLAPAEIDRVIDFLHAFCAEPNWPRGNLNFPRPLFTGKAFPENEAVFTFSMVPSHPRAIEPSVEYERRIGRRAQWELHVPVSFQQTSSGQWNRGLGDIGVAYKHVLYDSVARGTIASVAGEMVFASHRVSGEPPGAGPIFEGMFLFGQALPHDVVVQAQAGFERPTNHDVEQNSVFWRTAIGKTLKQNRWGRLWTPMVEVLAARELDDRASAAWDIVPQMQVSLSVFQHIRLNVGARLPVSDRASRSKALVAYLLWDWADGGLFDLWRAR